jgi:tetratricopeptide (TPR) repeat protein
MKDLDAANRTAAELRTLVENDPNPNALRYYEFIAGLIEYGRMNFRKSADLFRRASNRVAFEEERYTPDHALYYDALARALFECGEPDNARKEFERITLLTLGRSVHGDIYVRAFYTRDSRAAGERMGHVNYGSSLSCGRTLTPACRRSMMPEVAGRADGQLIPIGPSRQISEHIFN